MNETIKEAIESKRVLEMSYGGGKRKVEPFCYGLSRKGDELLRAYQIGGHSEGGDPVGWKLFSVAKVTELVITDQTFEVRPEYKREDSHIPDVFCRFE